MFDDAELQQELSRDYRHVRFRTITFAGGIGPPLSTSRSRSCELHPDVRLQFGPRRIPAREGWDKLVSAGFPHTITRGFVSVDDPHVAVCVLPGTELDFETEVRCERDMLFAWRLGHKVARFRQINKGRSNAHHNALP